MQRRAQMWVILWLILAIAVAALPLSDETRPKIGPFVAALAGGLLGFMAGLVSVSMYLSEASLLSAAACGRVFAMASRRIATHRLRFLLVGTIIASAGLASDFAHYVSKVR